MVKQSISMKAKGPSISFPGYQSQNFIETHQDFKGGQAPMSKLLILVMFVKRKLLMQVNGFVNTSYNTDFSKILRVYHHRTQHSHNITQILISLSCDV